MLIEIIVWLLIGALSGWIGFLASRPGERRTVKLLLLIGMVSSVAGGVLSENIGLSEVTGAVDATSSITALFASGITVTLYCALTSLLEKDN